MEIQCIQPSYNRSTSSLHTEDKHYQETYLHQKSSSPALIVSLHMHHLPHVQLPISLWLYWAETIVPTALLTIGFVVI